MLQASIDWHSEKRLPSHPPSLMSVTSTPTVSVQFNKDDRTRARAITSSMPHVSYNMKDGNQPPENDDPFYQELVKAMVRTNLVTDKHNEQGDSQRSEDEASCLSHGLGQHLFHWQALPVDPLLNPNIRRFVLFPIQQSEVRMYFGCVVTGLE